MNLLSIAFSFLMLIYLVTDYLESASIEQFAGKPAIRHIDFMVKVIPDELSVAEKSWSDKKNNREKNAQANLTVTIPTKKQKVLVLGEQNYILQGIFNDTKQPFVVLKDDNERLIRLTKNEKLGKDATLVSLETNVISLKYKGELIEFKLFERNK